MPETPVMPIDEQVRADLDAYFALTTSAELPPGVRAMNSSTLARRRRSLGVRLVAPVMTVAGAAAVVLVGLAVVHLTNGTATTSGAPLSAVGSVVPNAAAGDGAASSGIGAEVPTASAALGTTILITYPGVDAAEVQALMHISLFAPDGHGGASVSQEQARTAAAVATHSAGATSGPAVLAWVDFPGLPAPNTCLCWVVEVALPHGFQGGGADGAGVGPARSELVAVDANTGAVFAAFNGPGIA